MADPSDPLATHRRGGRFWWPALCLAVTVGLAVLVVARFGWQLWTALVLGVLLFCPLVIIWGLVESRRRVPLVITVDVLERTKAMRVSPRPLSGYPWYLRPFFWNQRRKYGAVLDAALLWARSPKVFLGVALLYGAIDRKSSPIPPALRSFLTVRVSQLNGCRFCVDLNSATLLKRGVPVDKVEALTAWRESSLFTEPERAALAYAEAMMLAAIGVAEDQMTSLKQHFDDDAIVELTALIAFQNMSSKFNAALAVPAQGFCRMPEIGLRTTRQLKGLERSAR